MDVDEFLTTLEELSHQLGMAIDGAQDLNELSNVFKSGFGKKGQLTQLKKALAQVEVNKRKELGMRLNTALDSLQSRFAQKEKELAIQEKSSRVEFDVSEFQARMFEDPQRNFGRVHPVTETQLLLEDLFLGMGFSIKEGPEVENEWYNFEALNIPEDHPARGMWDTLYIKSSLKDKLLLRTHTSPVQIRVMQKEAPPIYMVAPGKCYRRDTPDARHLASFHQIEGLVVDEGISFADLKGTIETFIKEYFGVNTKVRLRPSYFPFTEPSAEFEISCRICDGSGCRTCSNTGWIELGGCGMVHVNVLKACNIDPEIYSGFAFGFGIDRLTQMKYAVADLRMFIEPDLRFLASF